MRTDRKRAAHPLDNGSPCVRFASCLLQAPAAQKPAAPAAAAAAEPASGDRPNPWKKV